MQRTLTYIAAAVFSCLAVLPVSGSAADSQLRWKFTKGDQLEIVSKQDMKMAMTIQGNNVNTGTVTTTWMNWEVIDVDSSGVATITSSITRMQMNLDVPGLPKVVVDSDNPGNNTGLGAQLEDMVTGVVGGKFTQKMTPRGRVFDVVIPKEFSDTFETGPMGQLGMSADMFKDMTEKMSPEFPEAPLSKGEKWTAEASTPSPVGDLITSSEYIYQGLKDDSESVHRIELKLNMEFGKGDNQLGAEIDVTDQNNSGEILFDNQAGRLLKTTVNQKMTMQIKAAGQNLTQKITQSATSEVKPK